MRWTTRCICRCLREGSTPSGPGASSCEAADAADAADAGGSGDERAEEAKEAEPAPEEALGGLREPSEVAIAGEEAEEVEAEEVAARWLW